MDVFAIILDYKPKMHVFTLISQYKPEMHVIVLVLHSKPKIIFVHFCTIVIDIAIVQVMIYILKEMKKKNEMLAL